MGSKKNKQTASPGKTAAAPSPATTGSKKAAADALFGAAKPTGSFDAELDAFFKAAPATRAPQSQSESAKRKASDAEASSSAKKIRADEAEDGRDDSDEAAEDDEDGEEGDGDLSELDDEEMEAMAELMDADDSHDEVEGMLPASTAEEEEEEDDEAEVEQALLEDPDEDEDEDEGDELGASGSKKKPTSAFPIVHEALQKKGARKPKNAKFEDVDEPSELKDKRTLFIGNVPIEAVKSKSLQKRLQRHLTLLSPYPSVTRITSLRFRSIPFAVPTDDFSAESEEAAAKLAKRRERSKNYKEALAAVEGKDPASAHQFLTAKQKRKVAYINQDLNSHADTVNAYVTIGHPEAVFGHLNKKRLARQQSQAVADGKEAAEASTKGKDKKKDDEDALTAFDKRLTAPVIAALTASVADGQLFEGRHLRVDLVKPLEASEVIAAGLDKVTTAEGSLAGTAASGTNDPKRTVFVGNLDFEVKEEEIRSFFEKLLTAERGPPPETLIPVVGLDGKPPVQPKLHGGDADAQGDENSSDEEDDEDDEQSAAAKVLALHASSWVRSVRVIRDKATQMGKGIAYVRFLDTECVDEIMAIHEAEEAFFASVRGGPGGKGISNSALASTAIAVGGKQSEFKRKLKLRGRSLRVSRCKATTNAARRGGKDGKARKDQRRESGGAAAAGSSDEPRTPAKGARSTYRSSGAPTPNGSSPKPAKSGRSTPTSSTPTKKGPAAAPPPASAAAQEKAEMLSKLGKDERAAFKRNDAERQARRMEKKNKKKAANKVLKDAGGGGGLAGGKRERVKLPSKSGGSGGGKKGFSGAGAQNKKAKAKSKANKKPAAAGGAKKAAK